MITNKKLSSIEYLGGFLPFLPDRRYNYDSLKNGFLDLGVHLEFSTIENIDFLCKGCVLVSRMGCCPRNKPSWIENDPGIEKYRRRASINNHKNRFLTSSTNLWSGNSRSCETSAGGNSIIQIKRN